MDLELKNRRFRRDSPGVHLRDIPTILKQTIDSMR